MRLVMTLAVLAITVGCRPTECDWQCVALVADGGCHVTTPSCTDHCGGPNCPLGFELVEDAGNSCAESKPAFCR